jgi:drug/metabolite transporter (DMT)-like permease
VNLYRGHIALGFAVLFALIGLATAFYYVENDRALNEWYEVVMFMIGALTAILCLLLLALAYVSWVPKWERHEKRTGHVPGEERKSE